MFGCSAYIHVPKDERKKLDPKTKKCIFSGHGTSRKGYHLYDQKTSSIICSRDVVFNESSKGYEEEKQLIQVENFTEEEPEAPEPGEDSDRVESEGDSSEPERDDDFREPDREDSMDPLVL